MSRIVFLDRSTLGPGIDLRAPASGAEIVEYDVTAEDQVAGRIAGARIVVTNKVKIDEKALRDADSLKLIAVAATGTDVIDLDACRNRSISVCNIRNYARSTVPEHTFALILALRRGLAGYRDAVSAGRWAKSGSFCFFDYPINDLSGSTIGIVGDGVLGRTVADIARAFGMTVLISSYKGVDGMGPLYTPFETVLRQSDVITLHCPLMPSTRNMIGNDEFALMDRKPLLINTARGGLVDEDALADALLSGRIAGAGFDVLTEEPPSDGHPLMRLAGLPNFILTPHVAWASVEARQALTDQLIDNIDAYDRGQARNLVVDGEGNKREPNP
ncbi:MAG: D-2-hydroxyacid dehydrogenase [Oricola sp.]